MTTNVVAFAGAQRAPRSKRTAMDTIIVTPAELAKWRRPPFQRPLRAPRKVALVAQLIAETEVIPGVITLGHLVTDPPGILYLLDGQHRTEAFNIAAIPSAYVEVRTMEFESMGDMGIEFVELNSKIAPHTPEDILCGLEESVPTLAYITDQCRFVGYHNVRRGAAAPVVGMSVVLRTWASSKTDTPSAIGGRAAIHIAESLSTDDADDLIRFLKLAKTAWGTDAAHHRLWGLVNLVVSMWLYRQLVLDTDRGVKRSVVLTNDLFRKCLMSVAASTHYIDWLHGRNTVDKHRGAALTRLKEIFSARIREETDIKKVLLPQPSWAS